MAIHKVVHKFKGMAKDIAKESFPLENYFDARNIKIISTDGQSSFAIANERGTSKILDIPNIISAAVSGRVLRVGFTTTIGVSTNSPLIYSWAHSEIIGSTLTNQNHKIVGWTTTHKFIFIITTNDSGLDCVWKIWFDDVWNIHLVYINNLGLSYDRPLEVKVRYDSEEYIKIYFTDFYNQLRHIQVTDPQVHNLRKSFIDVVPELTLSQPRLIEKDWGGLNTSGVVQYAYNLYKINGSQSKLSATSELIPLASYNRGGDVNEVVGQINKIQIDNIDTNYDSIRVYRIKYSSYAQDPVVSIIADQKVSGSIAFFYDDGKNLYDVSLEELLFLGGDPIYPKTIETKDNRLFLANYKTGNFDIDFDARAFSFNTSGVCRLNNKNGVGTNYTTPENTAITIDAINANLDTYKYRKGIYGTLVGGKVVKTTGLGGVGTNVTYYLYQKTAAELDGGVPKAEENKFLKARETYRVAIEFYNKLGQYTLPKWIADFKAPHGNINGFYNILEVELSSAAIAYLKSQGAVGWRVLRAKRGVTDMQIVSQGIINPTIFQITNREVILQSDQTSLGATWEDQYTKLPTTFIRTFNDYHEPTSIPGENTSPLTVVGIKHGRGTFIYATNRGPNSRNFPFSEIFTEARQKKNQRRHLTYVHSKLMNFYSPEIIFNVNLNLEASLHLNPIGTYKVSENKVWGKKIDTNNRQTLVEYKNQTGLSLFRISNGDMHDYGLIGPSGRKETDVMELYQYYRKFSNFALSSNATENIELLDFPKVVEPSQEVTYANTSNLRFWNSLYTIISDDRDNPKLFGRDLVGIEGVNSHAVRSLVLATKNRDKLEDLYYTSTGIKTTTGLPVAELSRVLPNQYGGKDYESRKRTMYLRVGDYNNIDTAVEVLENPGDIFVYNFKFSRIAPVSKDVFSTFFTQNMEILEVPIETTIDLKNRNDSSIDNWDYRFHSTNNEYHNYNRVYSQESDWFATRDLEYTFKEVEHFPNAILATKPKIDNELIDSWTDILYNSEYKLDGTYGDITKLVSHNDNMMAFQPKAISHIAINPRVQTVSDDGVAIELGRGELLHDHKYLTTTSGSVNQYGILSTQTGVYYYDNNNKALYVIADGGLKSLSRDSFLDTYLRENIDTKTASIDNPYNGMGVLIGEDKVADHLLFVIRTHKGEFNLGYGLNTQSFTSFLDYTPGIVIPYKEFTISNNAKGLFTHYTGDYNNFYGTVYPSSITLLSNINNNDNIFNNLEFRSEVYSDSVENYKKTFDKIHVTNEYQDSNERELILTKNLFKKFRNWRIVLPRDKTNKLDRIRGPWSFIKLTFTPENDKFICHNITLYFENASIKA